MPELTQRSPLGSFPVTSGLLALLVAAFAIETLEGGSTETVVLLRVGANYPPLVLAGQWWRLLTSTLLHIGILHLAVNGWALWQLGRLSEVTFGKAITLALFVFTGIAGSALTLLSVKVSAGASGALFGIEGALVAFFLRHRERLTPVGKALLKQLLIWSAVMVVYSLAVPGIDVLGHLGGFLAGAAVGWALPPYRGGKEPVAAWIAAGVSLALIAAAIGGAILSRRFAEGRIGDIAYEAPAGWLAAKEDGLVTIYDPIGVEVSAERMPGDDPRALVDRVLEGEEIEAGATMRSLPGGWERRTFVRGELAGFVQARCDGGSCLLVVAKAPGSVYGAYYPVLDRVALSLEAAR